MSEAAGIISWLALLAVVASALAAALSDAVRFLIPNRYPAVIALSFAVYAVAKPAPFWAAGLIVAAVALVGGTVLFARGIVGGGDVKLFSATALWAGVDQFALLALTTALVGGVLALVRLLPMHWLPAARPAGAAPANDLAAKLQQPIPFGVAIACGGVCVALSRLAT
jgi:prepilin peptidase CpaA